jgi:hypothetical protein
MTISSRVSDTKKCTICGPANPSEVNVLWLQPHSIDQPHWQKLRNGLANEGMHLFVLPSAAAIEESWPAFGLVMIQIAQMARADVFDLVEQVRENTHAPLVLLTDWPHEWLLDSILFGADAVVSLNTTQAEILAHCNALLRRWRPRP